jgi:protease-4
MKTIFKIIKTIWKILITGVRVFANIILIVPLLILLVIVFYRPQVDVPDGAALILAPKGVIVERQSTMDPFTEIADRILGIPVHIETPLQDILDAINAASVDDKIKMLVIYPAEIESIRLNQLLDIGRAIEQFKTSGKKVIAIGDSFNQAQYYLAAHADEIFMNPMGEVELRGFGIYRLYMKSFLDKLNIQFHTFKVGTYKAALEPFTRDDMSPAAKEANQQWLDSLWSLFCHDIASQRNLTIERINNLVNNQDLYLAKNNGDSALMALNSGLVDALKNSKQLEEYLTSIVGKSNTSGFKKISFYDYMQTIQSSYTERQEGEAAVGIIIAQGDIVTENGTMEQIDGQSISRQIRKAGEDNSIKALVIRINSGGGSAFASEQIRQELLRFRATGKPVVISMASMAASGAYWLSADADLVMASPVTLTGSIGIFGAIPTFENTLAKAGIYSDGTGTTSVAGGASFARPLNPILARATQLKVEHGYHKFLTIISEGRDMDMAEVEVAAQGRIWDGMKAKELGLVDEIGSLSDAVGRAAELADMEIGTGIYLRKPDGLQALLAGMQEEQISVFFKEQGKLPSLISTVDKHGNNGFSFLVGRHDPENIYAHSLLPPSVVNL